MMTKSLHKNVLAWLTCLLLLMSGCTRDEQESMPPQRVDVTMCSAISAMTLSSDIDNKIISLRLLLFDSTGALIYNKKQMDNSPFRLRIVAGTVRAIMVANEEESWLLNQVTSPEELSLKEFQVNRPTSIPMYSDATYTISPEARTFTSTLTRAVVKVTINMSCNFATYKTTFKPYSIGIHSVAIKGYLTPRPYVFSTTAQTYNQLDPGDIITTATDLRTRDGGLHFYIPEKLISDTKYFSYIMISGYAGTAPDTLIFYTIAIGDCASKMYDTASVPFERLSAADLSLTRNTHITVTVTLKTVSNKAPGVLHVRMVR